MFLRKGIIKMKKLSEKEMRVVDGGKYVWAVCRKCGKKFPGADKVSAWVGWFFVHSIWHHKYGVYYKY